MVFDLNKAFDKSKLVQVQVTVNGKNGTFTRMQWKNPADVKSTDKVVGNQAVLDKFKKDQATSTANAAAAKANFDKSKFDGLKNANDKQKAMDYAKQCGVTWNAHSHAGINWMRCMQAVNKLVGNSSTPAKNTSKQQSNTQATQQQQQTAQQQQPIQQQQPAQQNASTKQTTQAQPSTSGPMTLSSNWNSKTKKEKMVELMSGHSRQQMMDAAKANGITWKEDKNSEGINWMRASMAIQKFIDGKSSDDMYKLQGFNFKLSQAMMGNQNAKKDGTTQDDKKKDEPKKDEPKKDESLIDVDSITNPRVKKLAEMLNNTKDEEELELYKSTGMIAEDDTAKDFLSKKLRVAYKEWKDKKGSSRRGRKHYFSSPAEFGQSGVNFLKNNSNKGVFKGINIKVYKGAFGTMRETLRPELLVRPREVMSVLDTSDAGHYGKFITTFTSLNRQFSDYGKIKKDGTISEQQYEFRNNKLNDDFSDFDEKKDGVCRVVNSIGEKLPELKDTSAEFIKGYKEYMGLLNNNYGAVTEFENYFSLKEVREKYKELNEQKENLDKVIQALEAKGLSKADMQKTFRFAYNFSSFTLYRADGSEIKDSNGKPITFDARTIVNVGNLPSTVAAERAMISKDGSFMDSQTRAYFEVLKKFDFDGPDNGKEYYKKILKAKMNMYGIKLIDKDTGNDVDLDKVPDDKLDYVSMYYTFAADGDNKKLDALLANINYATSTIRFMNKVEDGVESNFTPAKFNDNGNNVNKNFSWHNFSSNPYEPIHQDWAKMSWEEKFDFRKQEVQKQIDSLPVIEPEYLEAMDAYATAEGDSSYNVCQFTNRKNKDTLTKIWSVGLESYSNFEDVVEDKNPIYGLMVKQLKTMAEFSPQMVEKCKTKDKLNKFVDDNYKYTGDNVFDAKKYLDSIKQQETKSAQTAVKMDTNQLRALREEALSKVHCSIKTCDDATRKQQEHNVKVNWDKGTGTYSYISAVFNGSYEVRNSIQQEKMKEVSDRIGEKPQSFFHGTSYSGATGICGVDGKFLVPKSREDAEKRGLKYAGDMMGRGVYLANMAGKSAGYFGTWGAGYNKAGCLLVCDAVLGKHKSADKHSKVQNDYSVDSVSMQPGTSTGNGRTLRAPEWCVRNEDWVAPKYILDMECVNRK